MPSPPRLAPLLAFFFAVSLTCAPAQFSFTDRTDLLSNAGFGGDRCNSGVAIGIVDMNGDGRDDIIRLHDGKILSIELQAAPGAAFEHNLIGMADETPWALCVADVDRNGFNDLILAAFGGGIRLYSANADASAYAVSELSNSDIDCQGTLFADLNNDGEIDLFSCHDTADNVKWENYGDGNFVRNAALIDTDLGRNSRGNYAALWTDYDKDGRCDLYLSKCSQSANDPSSPKRINRMFKNGPSGFTDVAPAIGLADGAQSWSTDFADIDNDGDLDALIINHPEDGSPQPSRLMQNIDGNFQDITSTSGLASSLRIFGIQAVFRDFDNDGFVDLLVSSADVGESQPVYRIFRNNGNRTFTRQDAAFVVGGTTGGAGSALDYIQSFAAGDLNHDGFLDIYAGRATGFNFPGSEADLLFMNDGNGNHFITVRLTGSVSHPNAIGARVEIFGPWGTQTREVRSGEGYGIMNSLDAHFGLGAETSVDRVVVTWPSGFTTELTDVAADQFLAITEVVDPADFSAPVLTSPMTVDGFVDSSFSYRIHADNHPHTFSIANAPAGMSVDKFGTVLWLPASTGTFTFDITATNLAGSDSHTVSVEVLADLLPGSFEAENFVVTNDLDHPWFHQTSVSHDGEDAARAAPITDNEYSALEVTVIGPGNASFWWRVSSEEMFDTLSVALDGDEDDDNSISGSSGWLLKSISVPAGEHTIRWTYEKDVGESDGQDTGWIDEFTFILEDSDADGLRDTWEMANFGSLDQTGGGDFDGDGQGNAAEQASGTDPVDPESALRVTATEALEGGRVALTWDSVPGVSYTVQGSSDLTNWSDIANGFAGNSTSISATVQPGDGTPNTITLVPEIAAAHALVPTDGSLGNLWNGGDEAGFALAGGIDNWISGNTAVGYERSSGYTQFIDIDVEAAMYDTNSSVYVRVEFNVDDPTAISGLRLRMRYDDGFVAFVNGRQVAAQNNPNTLAWNSQATTAQSDSDAVEFEPFDITGSLDALVDGANVLAIHGLNRRDTSSDLLIQPNLVAERRLPPFEGQRFYWRIIVEQ